jgi:hypothetical protein
MTTQAFFKELQRLIDFFPKKPTFVMFSENTDLANQTFYTKNSSYIFDSSRCSDCLYAYDSSMCSNCMDCDYAVESQLCYESVDPIRCFNCSFVQNSLDLNDCDFCSKCKNSHDLFGCHKLDNQSFCIFNRKLAEQDYREKVKKYKTWSAEKVLNILDEIVKRFPKSQTQENNNENSSYGDYFFFNKNCYMMFDASYNENCCYLYDSFHNKMSMDATYSSRDNELSYQIIDSARLFNCSYSVFGNSCQDSSYLFDCFGLKNCLGCVKMDYKEYCILNRQLTKEEYERLSKQILAEINNQKMEWGNLAFK